MAALPSWGPCLAQSNLGRIWCQAERVVLSRGEEMDVLAPLASLQRTTGHTRATKEGRTFIDDSRLDQSGDPHMTGPPHRLPVSHIISSQVVTPQETRTIGHTLAIAKHLRAFLDRNISLATDKAMVARPKRDEPVGDTYPVTLLVK